MTPRAGREELNGHGPQISVHIFSKAVGERFRRAHLHDTKKNGTTSTHLVWFRSTSSRSRVLAVGRRFNLPSPQGGIVLIARLACCVELTPRQVDYTVLCCYRLCLLAAAAEHRGPEAFVFRFQMVKMVDSIGQSKGMRCQL